MTMHVFMNRRVRFETRLCSQMGTQNDYHGFLVGTLGHPLGTLALVRAQHTIFGSKLLPYLPNMMPQGPQHAHIWVP